MGKKSIKTISLLLSTTGVVLIVIACIIALVIPSRVDSDIHKLSSLILPAQKGIHLGYVVNSSPDRNFILYQKYYWFNIDNEEDVMKGASPKLSEHGPYIYEVIKRKIQVSFVGDTVSYIEFTQSSFNHALSAPLKETDLITQINPTFLKVMRNADGLSNYLLSVSPFIIKEGVNVIDSWIHIQNAFYLLYDFPRVVIDTVNFFDFVGYYLDMEMTDVHAIPYFNDHFKDVNVSCPFNGRSGDAKVDFQCRYAVVEENTKNGIEKTPFVTACTPDVFNLDISDECYKYIQSNPSPGNKDLGERLLFNITDFPLLPKRTHDMLFEGISNFSLVFEEPISHVNDLLKGSGVFLWATKFLYWTAEDFKGVKENDIKRHWTTKPVVRSKESQQEMLARILNISIADVEGVENWVYTIVDHFGFPRAYRKPNSFFRKFYKFLNRPILNRSPRLSEFPIEKLKWLELIDGSLSSAKFGQEMKFFFPEELNHFGISSFLNVSEYSFSDFRNPYNFTIYAIEGLYTLFQSYHHMKSFLPLAKQMIPGGYLQTTFEHILRDSIGDARKNSPRWGGLLQLENARLFSTCNLTSCPEYSNSCYDTENLHANADCQRVLLKDQLEACGLDHTDIFDINDLPKVVWNKTMNSLLPMDITKCLNSFQFENQRNPTEFFYSTVVDVAHNINDMVYNLTYFDMFDCRQCKDQGYSEFGIFLSNLRLILEYLEYLRPIVEKEVWRVFGEENLLTTRSVGDLMWGYRSSIVNFTSGGVISTSPGHLTHHTTAQHAMNDPYNYRLKINTGASDNLQVHKIKELQYRWPCIDSSSECTQNSIVEATMSGYYPRVWYPLVDHEAVIGFLGNQFPLGKFGIAREKKPVFNTYAVYAREIQNSWNIDYTNEDIDIFGIKSNTLQLSKEVFVKNAVNLNRFNVTVSGMWPLLNYKKVPMFISRPYFLYCDNELRSKVMVWDSESNAYKKMTRVTSLHETELAIEPISGTVTKSTKRFMTSFEVWPHFVSDGKPMSILNEKIPHHWIEECSQLSENEASELKKLIYLSRELILGFVVASLIVGLLSVVAGIILWRRTRIMNIETPKRNSLSTYETVSEDYEHMNGLMRSELMFFV